MVHRTFIDYVLGRRYCPACGKAAGFRGETAKGQKYKFRLAPIERFCNDCGAQIEGYVRSGFWFAFLGWGGVFAAGFFGASELATQRIISAEVAQIVSYALLAALWVSALFLVQRFVDYRVANAP